MGRQIRDDGCFFDVDIRIISRYLEQNSSELSENEYQTLREKD